MSELTWDQVRAMGVKDSPFQPIDEWLLAEQLDAEACRMLRPPGHARHSGWAEEPIVLWRSALVASIVKLPAELAARAIADSLSLRVFCRIGLAPAPTAVTLRSFFTQLQVTLQNNFKDCARAWVATPSGANRAEWYVQMNAWAQRIIGAGPHETLATGPRGAPVGPKPHTPQRST